MVRVALIDVMGSTSFAVLLRRSAARASSAFPELSEIAVLRDGMAYIYRLPGAWEQRGNDDGYRALTSLLQVMLPLAAEISGRLAPRRVVELLPLQEHGVIGPDDVARWKVA